MRGYRNATLAHLVLTGCCALAGCGRRDGANDSLPEDAPAAPPRDLQPAADGTSVRSGAGTFGYDQARPLLHSLSNDYQGMFFADPHGSEEAIIVRSLYNLGRVAETNDVAYQFLKTGTDPWFWKRFANWRTTNAPDCWSWLAGSSLQALALSGRPGMKEEIRAFRTANLNGVAENGEIGRDLCGFLMAAARINWNMETGGRAYAESNFSGETDWTEYAKWKASPDGQDWAKWSEAERQRRSRPPSQSK